MVALMARQATARHSLHRTRRIEIARQFVFHEIQEIAVRDTAIGQIHHLETVQCITVAGSVDLGFENGVLNAGEKAADAGEDIVPVGRVDQYLDALADRRQPRSDDSADTVGVAPQHACMPGHVAGVEANEIALVEMLP